MHIRSALLTALTFWTTSFSQHPAEELFASMVSESNLRRHVRILVDMGNRWGGTPSGDRAAAYVASKFKKYGMDVEVDDEPGRLVYIHRGWTLRVRTPERLRRLIRHEWLAGYSPAVKRTNASLVDLESDNMHDAETAGAVVLTEQLVSDDLYDDLVARGACAILSFAPADSGSYSQWSMITHLSPSKNNKIPLFNIGFEIGTKLRAELTAGTAVHVEFSAQTGVRMGSPKTVVGTLKGSSDLWRIVCAHGDSDAGGPGADDNASGVAGVLEMARVFSQMVRTGTLGRPTESIRFIVWGSEYYSTEHYVRSLGDSVGRIASVMNFDEIGIGATRNCVYFESNDVPHNEGVLSVLNRVGEEYAGKKGFWEEATTNPSQGGTDSYVFFPDYLEKLDVPVVEIPSVTVYTAAWNKAKTIPQTPGWTSKAWTGHPDSVTIDYSPYYHSSLDIPERTTEKEPFNMVWAVKAVGMALLRLSW